MSTQVPVLEKAALMSPSSDAPTVTLYHHKKVHNLI